MSLGSRSGSQDPIGVQVTALASSNWKTRWHAAQTLGELGNRRAVKPLLRTLEDSNHWVRIVAAEALGQIRDREATDALVRGLDDSSIWVRRASVTALGQIGDARAIAPLVERLLGPPDREWPEELRDAIAKALGAIGGKAIQVLIDALGSSDLWVSCIAARALGQIGDPKAIAPLAALAQRRPSWVCSTATQALAHISDVRAVRAALATPEAPRAFWKLKALREIDKSTIKQLTELLDDPDEHIRAQAAEVLNRLGNEHDTEPPAATLRAAYQSMPRGVSSRQRAPEDVLSRLRDEGGGSRTSLGSSESEQRDSLRGLVTTLSDPAAEVRLAAAEALGKLGDSSVIPALTKALQDRDSRVRAAAARSLGEIGRLTSRQDSSG